MEMAPRSPSRKSRSRSLRDEDGVDSYGTAPTPTRPFVSQLPKTPASKLKVAELKEELKRKLGTLSPQEQELLHQFHNKDLKY